MEKDKKDLNFYAYDYTIKYIKNIIKATHYWIIKSKIYNKRYNFNQDICQWEGWRIDARTSEPFYKNVSIIVLRRKFLPPVFNSFQCFHFVLTHNITRENYTLCPKANESLELAANSINCASQMNEKDYKIFLLLQMDSLVLDEENLLYFQNNLNLLAPEVYEHGFKILYTILLHLENHSSDKPRIRIIKQILEQKIKTLNSGDSIAIDM